MKKETAIAILIGLSLGLVITYGAYKARTALERKPSSTATTGDVSPSPTASAIDQVITLHNPQDDSVQAEKKTTVTGATLPLQYVVLFVNNTEYIRQSDDAGNFSFDVSLQPGGNILTLTTSDSANKMVSIERAVIVADLTAAEPTPSPSPTPKATKSTPYPTPEASAAATESTASVKQRIEKVLEKQKEQLDDVLATANGKMAGIVGEVTRVAQNSITVKHDDTTTILKMSDAVVIKKKDKKVALADVAVSDWVAVVGERDEDSLIPKLILLSSTSLRPIPKIVTFATISEIKKQQLTLIPRDTTQGETVSLTIDKQTKFEAVDGATLKLADFEEDFTVLAIGQKKNEDDTEYTVSTVRSLATKTKK